MDGKTWTFSTKMKRFAKSLYYVLCLTLITFVLGLVWFGFILPELPNREAAFKALTSVTGIHKSDVIDLRYDYDTPDFFGDDGHYFRFSYRRDDFPQVILQRLKATKEASIKDGLFPQNASWWDIKEHSDIVCYRFTEAPYQQKFLWISRENKLIFINVWDS